MRLVNLTPHAIVIYRDGEKILEISPSGEQARVGQIFTDAEPIQIDGTEIPVAVSQYGEVENLPQPEQGTMFIVSLAVAQAAMRPDLVVPDTSPQGAVRDAEGRIIGVKRLLRLC